MKLEENSYVLDCKSMKSDQDNTSTHKDFVVPNSKQTTFDEEFHCDRHTQEVENCILDTLQVRSSICDVESCKSLAVDISYMTQEPDLTPSVEALPSCSFAVSATASEPEIYVIADSNYFAEDNHLTQSETNSMSEDSFTAVFASSSITSTIDYDVMQFRSLREIARRKATENAPTIIDNDRRRGTIVRSRIRERARTNAESVFKTHYSNRRSQTMHSLSFIEGSSSSSSASGCSYSNNGMQQMQRIIDPELQRQVDHFLHQRKMIKQQLEELAKRVLKGNFTPDQAANRLLQAVEEEVELQRRKQNEARLAIFTSRYYDNLYTFPHELWIAIFAHLSPRDLFAICQVCKYFSHIAEDGSLWKTCYEREIGMTLHVNEKNIIPRPWKQKYIKWQREWVEWFRPESKPPSDPGISEPTLTFKFIFFGAPCSGKTSLIRRFVENAFDIAQQPTASNHVVFRHKIVGYSGKLVQLRLDDHRHFLFENNSYLRCSHGAFLCFDLTRALPNDIAALVEATELPAVLHGLQRVVVGTKSDFSRTRAAPYEAMKSACNRLDLPYIETSAKTDFNVDLAFKTMVEAVFKPHLASIALAPKPDSSSNKRCTIM